MSGDAALQSSNDDYIKGHRKPDPTPEEIAAECLQIQAEWSEAERMKRLGGYLSPEYVYRPEREKCEEKYLGDDEGE